jgi:hypothetical protein
VSYKARSCRRPEGFQSFVTLKGAKRRHLKGLKNESFCLFAFYPIATLGGHAKDTPHFGGPVAEWLRSGLQIRVKLNKINNLCVYQS